MTMQDIAGSSTEFTVSYDGDALSEHRMDAQELGTALLALGSLFDRANLLLNGEGTSIELEVRSTPAGSFEIELYLAQAYLLAAPFITSGMVKSAADLITIVVGGDGLITLIKRLRGKKPNSVSDEDSTGRVTLEIEGLRTENMSVDYLYLDAPSEVGHLIQDKIITDAAADVVSPLFKNGIDSVTFRQHAQELESVSKDEAYHFRFHNGTEIDELIIPHQELVVISPNLGFGKNKWRLNDSLSTNWYSMNDEQFLDDIHRGIVQFGVDNVLVCEVKVTTTVKNGKPHKEFEISKVFEHRSQGHQPPLQL